MSQKVNIGIPCSGCGSPRAAPRVSIRPGRSSLQLSVRAVHLQHPPLVRQSGCGFHGFEEGRHLQARLFREQVEAKDSKWHIGLSPPCTISHSIFFAVQNDWRCTT